MSDFSKDIEKQIKLKGEEFGFSDVGVVLPNSIPEAAGRLKNFLVNGYHGQMEWLERRSSWRSNPESLWPEVKSIIVVAENYAPTDDPLRGLNRTDLGNISVYAHGRDYHDVLKKRRRTRVKK